MASTLNSSLFSQAGPSFEASLSPLAAAGRNVAIVGFGTVGCSVARILSEHPHPGLRLVQVCTRNVERRRVAWLPPRVAWTENFADVLNSKADVVVELIGGLDPAVDWVRAALRAGKSVVTANKKLIAHHGPELTELARQHGCRLLFGASVAGGIPVISGLQDGLAGDRLSKICGILNGTCNFILTRIEAGGMAFESALQQAQKLGFAEADPAEDIAGFDARAKLAILVRLALHTQVDPEDIACNPISSVHGVDFAYAKQLGCTIRQVSRAELNDERLFASVQPALVPLTSPLARVQDSLNLVMATGQYGGETVFSGHGAGGDPTAVAVVSDLVALAQDGNHAGHKFAQPVYRPCSGDFSSRHYLRFTIKDRPGILAQIATVLSKHEINIDSVLQHPGYDRAHLPFVVTADECPNSVVERAMKEVNALDFLVQPTLNLPILA